MKDYTSPVVLENEELAEGVFTASGAVGTGNCWYFNRAWIDNNRVEEEYWTWHVEWIHDGGKVEGHHSNGHSGGLTGYIYVKGAALTDVYIPGGDNSVKVVRVENANTIYFEANREWGGHYYHYVNNGPEPITFNICIKSDTPENSALLEITGGSMISCLQDDDH